MKIERTSVIAAGTLLCSAVLASICLFHADVRAEAQHSLSQSPQRMKPTEDPVKYRPNKPTPGSAKEPVKSEETESWNPDDAEGFADSVLTTPSLLRLASSRRFDKATHRERIPLLQEWIREHKLGEFRELSVKERDRALKLLERWLDDLLAEKGFRVPRDRAQKRA